MQDKYYTIKEIAEIFKVTTVTVRNWIYDKKTLRAVKMGNTVRISQKDLDDFMKEAIK